MTVKHHPSEALLLAYAAGHVGEGVSLLVATHLTYCPACRAAVAEAEAVGGALLEEALPVSMNEGALAAVLDRLESGNDGILPARTAPTAHTPHAHTPARPSTPPRGGHAHQATLDLPAPLRSYVGDLSGVRWQWMAPGIRQVDVTQRPRGRDTAKILRIAPGRVLPRHGHMGLELTLVLHGSFTDEQGRFTAGDLAELDQDADHQPIADSGEECICLIGTDAPLRFSGFVPRMIAPMLGF
ncbi:transcriptional regulator [Roseospira marina]|uniref:Transcriptional regulator n=1 Tax=Roseospira marina TaxID=140057 RepID=A0A5M6I9B4_9PROT|nr:ChrR family anti-sigma-E factor [Roseospira marina]KAA5604557.1 transcriptional regulator [Roseospira marina]MBB4315304.1 putative transcriptional regulator [Roseospira marina]MBB5088303.1 putative transcriptional regulator [Roseospira marina]